MSKEQKEASAISGSLEATGFPEGGLISLDSPTYVEQFYHDSFGRFVDACNIFGIKPRDAVLKAQYIAPVASLCHRDEYRIRERHLLMGHHKVKNQVLTYLEMTPNRFCMASAVKVILIYLEILKCEDILENSLSDQSITNSLAEIGSNSKRISRKLTFKKKVCWLLICAVYPGRQKLIQVAILLLQLSILRPWPLSWRDIIEICWLL